MVQVELPGRLFSFRRRFNLFSPSILEWRTQAAFPYAMFNFFSSKPSKDKFAQIVQKHLTKTGAPGAFEYRKEDFTLRNKDAVFHMTNMYNEYCTASGERRRSMLDNIASIFRQ